MKINYIIGLIHISLICLSHQILLQDILTKFGKKESIISKLISNSYKKIKKSEIYKDDQDALSQATQLISKLLDSRIAKKVKEASMELEKSLKLTINRTKQSKSKINVKNCVDILDNCQNLKLENVCNTSPEAMRQTCSKTCGYCGVSKRMKLKKKENTKYTKKRYKTKNLINKKHTKQSSKTKMIKSKKSTPKNKKNKHHKKSYKETEVTPIHNIPCPDICKQVCLDACPKRCCNLFKPVPTDGTIIAKSQECTNECQNTCTPGCPNECCLRDLLMKVANSANMEDKQEFINKPYFDYSSPVVDTSGELSTNFMPNAQGECPNYCQKDCLPQCKSECCQLINNNVNLIPGSNAVINSFSNPIFDASKWTPTEVILNKPNFMYSSEIGPEFKLTQTEPSFSSPSQTNLYCPNICSTLCEQSCPKRCCTIVDEENEISTTKDNDTNKRCNIKCKDHCTPDCLYNHCCED